MSLKGGPIFLMSVWACSPKKTEDRTLWPLSLTAFSGVRYVKVGARDGLGVISRAFGHTSSAWLRYRLLWGNSFQLLEIVQIELPKAVLFFMNILKKLHLLYNCVTLAS